VLSLDLVDERKRLIQAELIGAQQALIDVLDRVGPDDWQRPSPNEGWTVLHLLTHLSTSETGFVTMITRMAAGEGGVPRDFDPNRWNAGQLRRNTDATPETLRANLERAAVEIEALLATLDDQHLDRRGYLSTGEEGSTEDALRLNAAHKRSHTEDIRAALTVAAN